MCLSVPGKIVKVDGVNAIVDFGGSRREISIMLVPDVKVGDYVLVHAGFAIQILEEEEAKKTIDVFKEVYNE